MLIQFNYFKEYAHCQKWVFLKELSYKFTTPQKGKKEKR